MRSYSDSLSRCSWIALLVVFLLLPAVAIDPLGLNSPVGITAPVSADSGEGWYLVGAPFIKKGNVVDDSHSTCSGNTLSISDGSASGSMSCLQPSNTYSECGGTWTGTATWTPPPSFMQAGSEIYFTASVKTTGPECEMHGTHVWIWDGTEGAEYIVDAFDNDTTHDAESCTALYKVRTGSPGAKLVITVVMDIANIGDNTVTYNYTYGGSGTPAPTSTLSPKAFDAPGPLVNFLPYPPGEKPVGFISTRYGSVYVSAGPSDLPPSQQKWMIVTQGNARLYEGWTIRTGPASEAFVQWVGDDDLERYMESMSAYTVVGSLSWFDAHKPVMAETTVIRGRLFKGVALHRFTPGSEKMFKESRMEARRAILTPKGTIFVVEESDTQTLLKVIEGTVEFTSKKDGRSATIEAGQMIAATDSGLGQKSTFDVAAEKAKWGPMPPDTTTSTGAALVAESRTASPNSTVQLPIRINKASNIGSMNFVLTYDPQVLKVNKVDGGSLLSGALFTPNFKTPPLVRFGLATSSGVRGSGSVAYIEFQVIGAAGSSSPLTLSEVDATDTSGKSIAVTTSNGTVTVASGSGAGSKVKGDYNGDGRVTELDTLAALKMSVKLLTEDLNLDMDGNSKVTAADSRLILKQALGK